MTKRLEGRTAVITGASKGLGKAMALELAAEGAMVLQKPFSPGELRQTVRNRMGT